MPPGLINPLQSVVNACQTIVQAINSLLGQFNKITKNAKPGLIGNPMAGLGPLTNIPLGATLAFDAGQLQTLALTGFVTTAPNSFVTSLGGGSIPPSSLAPQAADTFLGNNTGTTASPVAFTVSQFYTMTAAASLTATGQALSGGATVTSHGYATGSITVDPGLCPLQYISNNGAFTITAPIADGSCILQITNTASAGVITWTGFTVSAVPGDTILTTSGDIYDISIVRINGTSTYIVKALQ
jgi:hypothetical protein